jgi:hypothetical protein
MYPGIAIATAYAGLCWAGFWLWSARPPFREFLGPLLCGAAGAVLLGMPRALPFLLVGGGSSAALADTSEFTLPMLGTLQFGYGWPGLPNDISMRSFFVPATALALLPFARLTSTATRSGLALAVPAALFGLPFWPWFGLVQHLPGLALSRFTMSDFKPFLVFGLLVVASGAAVELRASRGRVLGAVALVGVLALVGIAYYPASTWVVAWLLLVLCAGAVVLLASSRLHRRAVWPVLAALTLVSGVAWAAATPAPWDRDRERLEQRYYGAPVASLLKVGEDQPDVLRQRPARAPVP